MKFKSLFVILAALLASPLAHAAYPTVVTLASNLPANGSGLIADTTTWFAQSFTIPTATPATTYAVADIQVGLALQGKPNQQDYTFHIYSSTTGTATPEPKTSLGSFANPGLVHPSFIEAATAGTPFQFVLQLTGVVNVKSGNTYWIVLQSTNPATITSHGSTVSNPNLLSWLTSTNSTYGGNGTATLGAGATVETSDNQGSSWTVAGNSSPMSISVDIQSQN